MSKLNRLLMELGNLATEEYTKALKERRQLKITRQSHKEHRVILNIPDEDEFIQELAELFDTPLISEARYQRVLDLFSGYRMEVKKVEVHPDDFGWVVPKKKMD